MHQHFSIHWASLHCVLRKSATRKLTVSLPCAQAFPQEQHHLQYSDQRDAQEPEPSTGPYVYRSQLAEQVLPSSPHNLSAFQIPQANILSSCL